MQLSETAMHAIEGVIVFGLIIFIYSIFFGVASLQAAAQNNLTEGFSVTMPDYSREKGPVTLIYTTLGSLYTYNIKIMPSIKLSSPTSGVADIIAVVEFKGKSVRATINGADKLTINTNDAQVFPISAIVTSQVPPIVKYSSPYSSRLPLKQGTTILVEGAGGLLVEAVTSTRLQNILPETIDNLVSECRTEFVLECKSELKITDFFYGCTEERPNACRQSIDMCGDTATIIIRNVDCVNNAVDVDSISYSGGEEWEPGEKVQLSFWLDTECTRRTDSYLQLLSFCRNDYAGRYDINAGILP